MINYNLFMADMLNITCNYFTKWCCSTKFRSKQTSHTRSQIMFYKKKGNNMPYNILKTINFVVVHCCKHKTLCFVRPLVESYMQHEMLVKLEQWKTENEMGIPWKTLSSCSTSSSMYSTVALVDGLQFIFILI